MQLNYHEGENLSSLGDTLSGGCWNGADQLMQISSAGLFYYGITTAPCRMKFSVLCHDVVILLILGQDLLL